MKIQINAKHVRCLTKHESPLGKSPIFIENNKDSNRTSTLNTKVVQTKTENSQDLHSFMIGGQGISPLTRNDITLRGLATPTTRNHERNTNSGDLEKRQSELPNNMDYLKVQQTPRAKTNQHNHRTKVTTLRNGVNSSENINMSKSSGK